MDLKATRSGHETLGLGDDDLLKMYRCMLLVRRVDERSWILNRQGKAAFVISCQGHEATVLPQLHVLVWGNKRGV
jgi:2-oxoisovalerate dehydrogenase E1 component alpha subunit